MPNLDIKLVNLKRITDPRGNLVVAETPDAVPFDIQRAYWIYEVPEGAHRGGHAHRHLQQLLVAVNGSFRVTLDNGSVQETVWLHQPHQGLLVDAGIWCSLSDFSAGTVCLVLASARYDANDYINDYDEFLTYARCTK